MGGIRFVIEPNDAEVIVDGEPMGTASELPPLVEFEAGIHQILVRKDGFQTWRAEVAIRDQTETITVTLEPKTP